MSRNIIYSGSEDGFRRTFSSVTEHEPRNNSESSVKYNGVLSSVGSPKAFEFANRFSVKTSGPEKSETSRSGSGRSNEGSGGKSNGEDWERFNSSYGSGGSGSGSKSTTSAPFKGRRKVTFSSLVSTTSSKNSNHSQNSESKTMDS